MLGILDPDRRVAGRRSTRMELGNPDLDSIRKMLRRNPNAAIKLAPACEVPDDWRTTATLEWIGHDGECKQLVARFGAVANQESGARIATVVQNDAASAGSVFGSGDELGEFVEGKDLIKELEGNLFEPHSAVRAAGLVNALAAKLSLRRVAGNSSYMIGEPCEETDLGLLSRFKILKTQPFDRKRLKKHLVDLGFGSVEVKSQSKLIDANREQKRLNSELRRHAKSKLPVKMATLIAIEKDSQLVGVIAERAELGK